jgi:divalent metal cation (Fe/Co/Zn/Cd) transporter
VFQLIATLLGYFSRPQESLVGIAITLLSAVLMTRLFFYKNRIAEKIGSRALRAKPIKAWYVICKI